jgi:tetratricopeptide (TPR) repeat protein
MTLFPHRLFTPFALVLAAGCSLTVAAVWAQDRSKLATPEPQAIDPPLGEQRLPVHTLLREDLFAAFLANDMNRLARGEKNIDKLLETRPNQKGNLLAWKGGVALYNAVRAYEAKKNDEFQRQYKQALDYYAEAGKETSGNEGLNAIRGGSFALFADRLPKEKQAAAWSQAYDSYQAIWKTQSAVIDSLPVHFRGEVLAGLALCAERTGRTEEAEKYLKRIVKSLPGTPYETAAKTWIEKPSARASATVACLSCHEAGRLADRKSRLDKQ